MTDYRSRDQIAADFQRIDPSFSQINRRNQLMSYLSDDPMGDATNALVGNGPVLFNLGVLDEDGEDWKGVRAFLDSELVSDQGRKEFQQLESDLRAADTNGDHYLNNQEVVSFAQSHSDRWANVALFRTAADSYLNRLPAYLTQPNLTEQQVSRVWGVMNEFAQEWDAQKVDPSHRGTIYGLSLDGFPSTDRSNPPALIRRAISGELTPEELAAVHQLFELKKNPEGRYQFEGSSPLSPEEIGMLGTILDGAAQKGHSFQGMTIVAGEEEKKLFADRDQAAKTCQDSIAAAREGGGTAMRGALGACDRAMAPIEADHPERISATTLTMRAFMGQLTPAEVSALRTWMRDEARSQGLTCDGALDCMKEGALRFFKGIASDPWHFIARNGAFIGGAYLYRRFALQKLFENRLSKLCEGRDVANPREAYRDFEKFVKGEIKNQGWKSLPRRILQNPYVGLAIFNFGIAPLKDTGNLGIDILTDQLLLPLTFEALETSNVFRNSLLKKFLDQNSDLCRPQEKNAPQEVEDAVPESDDMVVRDNLSFLDWSPTIEESWIRDHFRIPSVARLNDSYTETVRGEGYNVYSTNVYRRGSDGWHLESVRPATESEIDRAGELAEEREQDERDARSEEGSQRLFGKHAEDVTLLDIGAAAHKRKVESQRRELARAHERYEAIHGGLLIGAVGAFAAATGLSLATAPLALGGTAAATTGTGSIVSEIASVAIQWKEALAWLGGFSRGPILAAAGVGGL